MLERGEILLCFIVINVIVSSAAQSFSPWAWKCNETNADTGECKRISADINDEDQESFTRCKLTCGTYGALWPQPKYADLGKNVSYFIPSKVQYQINAPLEVTTLLEEAIPLTIELLLMYNPVYNSAEFQWPTPQDPNVLDYIVQLNILVNSSNEILDLQTDESYILSVTSDLTTTLVEISAETYFGARHGLETFSQLVEFEKEQDSLQIISQASITDKPTYPHRGISLDTSRNFIPVADIKRTIDGMSYTKLNSLHWHLTDSHSYPLFLNNLPDMAYYGAYSTEKMYYPADVVDIVNYGKVRGVRIVPEFDAPAHVGYGWQWGENVGLGHLVVCLGQQPWEDYCSEPPCGQFNIANEKIYDILKTMYTEWFEIFGQISMFHYGGDEINLNCWNSTLEIQNWMLSKNYTLLPEDYYAEWSVFQNKVMDLVTSANGGIKIPGVIWTSALTNVDNLEAYINKDDYIVQIWTAKHDKIIEELLIRGYNLIYSNYDALYLDCGFGNWVSDGHNWCSPFKSWKDVYDNSPYEITDLHSNVTGTHYQQIIGAEVALWTEQVDGNNLDSRLWPRGSALGERLWNDIPGQRWRDAAFRFINNRERLVKRGLRPDGQQPLFCYQNSGECNL